MGTLKTVFNGWEMDMDKEAGQKRVRAKEMNNRNTGAAKGPGTTTPKKRGATRGFASNKTKGKGIFGRNG